MIVPRPRKSPTSWLVRVAPFRATTVYSSTAAIKLEADLKNRKALGLLWEADPNTLSDELEGLSDRQNATRKLSARTIESHELQTRSWAPLHRMLVSNLNRQMIEDHFVAHARTAPVAANKSLQRLKVCLREASSRGQRIDPAIFDIKPVRHKPRRGKALTVVQLLELASWAPEHARRLFTLGGLVGPRQHFWFALTEDLVDLDNGRMIAPADLQKNGKEHQVCLTELETSLFREQLLARAAGTRLYFTTERGHAWTRWSFRKRVWMPAVAGAARADRARQVEAEGLDADEMDAEELEAYPSVYEDFTFHMLRHTAGSLMALSGMDPATASERLGHTDGGALFLKTYRHLYEGERRRNADRFGVFIRGELEPPAAAEVAL